MDLAQALDAVLHGRYRLGPKSRWREPRSPVDTPRGLRARLNMIMRRVKGDEKRAAREVGVTPRTLKKWMTGKAKPSAASRGKVTDAFARVVTEPAVIAAHGLPSKWNVQAVVVADPGTDGSPGSRYKNVKRDGPGNEEGWRNFKAEGLDSRAIVSAWITGGGEAAAAELTEQVADAYQTQFAFEGENVTVWLED